MVILYFSIVWPEVSLFSSAAFKKLTSFSLSFTPYLFYPLRSSVASEIFSGYILYHISSIVCIPFVLSHLSPSPSWCAWAWKKNGEVLMGCLRREEYFWFCKSFFISPACKSEEENYTILEPNFRNTRQTERVLWTLACSDFSALS